MQGVDNRGLVMGKLETAGGSHRMGGQPPDEGAPVPGGGGGGLHLEVG